VGLDAVEAAGLGAAAARRTGAARATGFRTVAAAAAAAAAARGAEVVYALAKCRSIVVAVVDGESESGASEMNGMGARLLGFARRLL